MSLSLNKQEINTEYPISLKFRPTGINAVLRHSILKQYILFFKTIAEISRMAVDSY
jgi:hypothetical protein